MARVHGAWRSHVSIWKWVQRLGSLLRGLFACRARVALVDEGQVQIGSERWWFWLALEPSGRCILHLKLSAHRNGLVAYWFLRELKARCGVRYVLTDGAPFYPWACGQLRLRRHVAPLEVRNLVERCIEALRDRLRGFDAYFPCRCSRKDHVRNFLALWRHWYNHVRHHMELGRPPWPAEGAAEYERLESLVREVIDLV
ncbi:MAG: hypothetical protein ACE5GD_10840 [Candidatus Geothermarchaeales archaeon]